MTPDAIIAQLPNGFHDAVLQELGVDFAKAEARLKFEFLVGMPDAETEEEREAMRPGVLWLMGVTSTTIEPPSAGYQFSEGEGVYVDGGFGAYPDDPAPPDDGLVRLWLYISTWDARMMFTAKGSEVEW